MKTIQTVQGLCLMAVFAGTFQVWALLEIPLTMFHDSVDDQYVDCNPFKRLALLVPGKLPVVEKYRRTWETAKRHWDSLGPSVSRFDPLYGTALVAYTVGDDLYRDFNTATREAGRSRASYRHYAFRDFHFLLTKAVQAKAGGGVCYQVFRGIQNVRFTLSDETTVVRFGQFASSSLDETVAINYGQDTFFSIRTCYGARVDDVSYHPDEKEVLIPPYEIFAVTAYHQTEKGVHITLESRGVFSRRNCDSVNAARVFTATRMPFLLCGLLLTWTTLGSLGCLS